MELASASPNTLNALQWHVVKRGETLSTIARKLRVNRTDLAEANYLRTTSGVKAGQKLLVPRMPSAALLARAASGVPVQTADNDAVPADLDTTPTETVSPDPDPTTPDPPPTTSEPDPTQVEIVSDLLSADATRIRVGARALVDQGGAYPDPLDAVTFCCLYPFYDLK